MTRFKNITLSIAQIIHRDSIFTVHPKIQILMLIGLFFVLPTSAQQLPMDAPLIATNTVALDKIVLYDVTNDTYRDLSFGNLWHHVWDFSADGCRILFTMSDGIRPAKLYSARIDGRDLRKLVQYSELDDELWGIWEPDVAPDGSKIAFTMVRDQTIVTSDESERQYHIAWITPDGGEPQFYSVTGQEHSPQWSPNSEWLVYTSYNERIPGADIFSTAVPTSEPVEGVPTNNNSTSPSTTITEADLWVVSNDGETKYPLTNFPTGNVTNPRWSPDSELVGFNFSPSPNNDTVWMIGNQQNAIPTQLMFQWSLVLDITWLPDSTHIIASMRDFNEVSENRLWKLPLFGNVEADATRYLDALGLSHADYPRFSPDRNWLAVRSAYELALINLNDASLQWLDSSTSGNTPAVWSPIGFAGEKSCR
jgi:Tol biopolymer transport system component